MKFILFLILSFQLFSIELEKVNLNWKKISTAKEYKLEIRNKKGFFKTLATEQTEIKISLAPGIYEYRVGVVNKFGKVKNFSKWENLEIIYTTEPIIETKPFKFYTSDFEKTISIRGKHFLEEMKLFLKSENKTEQVKFKFVSEEEIQFNLDLKDERNENLELIFENPKNKITKLENFIVLKKSKSPILSTKNLEPISPEANREFNLSGENFTEDTKVFLVKDGEKKEVKDLKIKNSNELSFKYDFEIKESSNYNLIIENPLNRNTVVENFVSFKGDKNLAKNSTEVSEEKKETKKDYSIYPPLWRSAIFPGYGQFYKGEKLKASIFAGSTILLFGLIYYFEEEKKSALSRSNEINNRLYLIPSNQNTVPVGLLFYFQSNSFYEKAVDFESKQNLAIYSLIGLWSYNLFDIYKNRRDDLPSSSFIFNLNFISNQRNSVQFGYQIRF